MTIDLDLTALTNAIRQFSDGLNTLAEDPENALFRDGVIQRFEFTYELAHKTLKRYLKMTSASPDVIALMDFQELIRTGNEQGLLLSGWEKWKQYRQARNDCHHTYNEAKARAVIEKIPDFLLEARFLLRQLDERVR